MQEAKFQPRQLGHVNLWVSDLERSIKFYESVCGIELVRRERDILIGFHSNGNTHHDVGIIEVSRGKDRYGRDGTLQIPKTRGLAVGLNHLGWEMENEKELVDAYTRALASGFPIQRCVDHLISHSVYVSDPDGNGHEFYADEISDWRRIYNLDIEDEVTGLWDPLAKPPKTDANYNVDPPIRRVEGAPVHPSRIIGTRFATARFDEMKKFFVSIAGLKVVRESSSPAREVGLAGALGRVDLTLVEVPEGAPTGLQSFKFQLESDIDVAEAVNKLKSSNVDAHAGDGKSANLVIRDPDGFVIEFQRSAA